MLTTRKEIFKRQNESIGQGKPSQLVKALRREDKEEGKAEASKPL